MEAAVAGSDTLRDAIDAVSGAAGAARDVCTRASTLLKLLHEHLLLDENKRPEGLDSQVAAFGTKSD